jgi:peptidyl-prolyl cis-trans isomerase D
MLKSMRRNVKKLAPTLWLVIAAFIVTIFAVWGGAGRLGESRAAGTIVTVGKEKISSDFYFKSLRQTIEGYKRQLQLKDIDSKLISKLIQQSNFPQEVLNQIIRETLLFQKAQELGIDASLEEIGEKIKSFPGFQKKDGKFVGEEEYKRRLEWSRISYPEFEESLRKDIILSKFVKVLTAGITITPEELWESYKNKNESAKLEFVILETEKIELKEEPALSEIKAHFEQNKEEYKIPERREATYVFFKTDDLKAEIELTDSEIEEYYKDNESQFKDPERLKVSRIYLPFEQKEKELVLAEAEGILEKIKGGEDFGDLAKRHSKDDKAANAGDWGLYEWQTLSPKEKEEFEKLSEGQTTGFVELEDGVSILKVTEKKPAETRPLEVVQERIKNILEDQKAREMAEDRINRLEKRAKREKSLDTAAQTIGLELKNTGLLKKGETIEEIDSSGTISTTLFELEEKEMSSPVYTYKGVGIAQLEKVEPPRQANFEEVEEEVKEEFLAVKKKGKALERMKKVKAELRKGSLEDLAEKHGLEFRTAAEHMRGGDLSYVGENSEIDELTFSLPLNEGSDPIEFEEGYALIKILERIEVTQEDFEKDKEAERENLLEDKKRYFLHSYISKLIEEKKVERNWNLFLKVSNDVLSRYERVE